jgi:hypothetical protein
VAQLVEALRYKPEVHRFDSRLEFFIGIILPALGSTQPLTETSSYQECLLGGKSGRCVRLTTLPPSCADCLEILGASTSWNPQGLSRDSFTFICNNSVLQMVKENHSTGPFCHLFSWIVLSKGKVKVKLSLYTPGRYLGGGGWSYSSTHS